MNANTHGGAAQLSLLLEVDETVGGVGGGHFISDSSNSARKVRQHLINVAFQLFLVITNCGRGKRERVRTTQTFEVSTDDAVKQSVGGFVNRIIT